ncbi:hypothetical protein D9M73_102490 [compost metagenome]
MKDAGLARRMAPYRRVRPLLAEWSGNVVAVEVPRDRAGAFTIGELSKDPLNDQSFRLVDRSLATNQFAARIDPLKHTIAVAQATARFALLDPSP